MTLIDRAFIPMHGGHHPFEDGIEQLPGFLRIAVGQKFHRAFQVGKQHGDLFALAFQGTAGGQESSPPDRGECRSVVYGAWVLDGDWQWRGA